MQRWHFRFLLISAVVLIPTVYAQFHQEYRTHLDDDLLLYCNRETAYSTGVSDARKGLARKEDFAQVCRVNRAEFNLAYNSGYNYGLINQSGLVVNEPAPAHPEVQNQLPSSYVQPYTRPVVVTSVNPNYAPNPNVGISPGSPVTAVSSLNTAGYDGQASRTPIYPAERAVPTGDLAKHQPEHGLRALPVIVPSAHYKCIETPTGIACGYNCINSLNNVRCATAPDQICRSNDLGEIACGFHCISTVKAVRCALKSDDVCVADNNGNVLCGVNCRVERNAIGVCDIERYAP